VRHPRAADADHRRMPELSRQQLLVYGAIAVALLLVGVRWVRSADGATPGGEIAAASTGSAGGSFDLDKGGDAVVHVAGAVRSPGVYRLPAGSRVTDAIDRAGGPSSDADQNAINLAARIADGQQVVVPARVSASGAATTAGTADPDAPISLGTATVEQLDTIEGIGPVTAEQIVEFRDQNGGVSSVDDLDQISGIGPATMEALRSRLQP
jgi:competence protein ComEA